MEDWWPDNRCLGSTAPTHAKFEFCVLACILRLTTDRQIKLKNKMFMTQVIYGEIYQSSL